MSDRFDRRLRWLLPLMLLLAGALVYANSLRGEFVFDDEESIVDNMRIRTIWPVDRFFTQTARPLPELSFAVNYAIGRLDPLGYHLFNTAVHLLAGLTLFGLVRRTLRTPRVIDAGWFDTDRSRELFAFTLALLWVVHPLNTQAVSYVVQRGESMMGLFYLLALYAVARAGQPRIDSRKPMIENPRHSAVGRSGARSSAIAWSLVAVLAAVASVSSKQVGVTIPVVALLYDRTFVTGSFRQTLHRRLPLYAGLLLSWLVLAYYLGFGSALVQADATAGFRHKIVTPTVYVLTQPGVIIGYLFTALWPAELCLDRLWPSAEGVDEWGPPMLAVALLFLGSTALMLWGGRRERSPLSRGGRGQGEGRATTDLIEVSSTTTTGPHPGPAPAVPRGEGVRAACAAVGFLGFSFFTILSPTSSFVPIQDLAVEHRMYLSLICLIAALLGAGCWLLRRTLEHGGAARLRPWLAGAAVLTIAAALGARTVERNRDYRTAVSIWSVTAKQVPGNARAWNNLASATARRNRPGDLEAALAFADTAIGLAPGFAEARYNRGACLMELGRLEEAAEEFERTMKMRPRYVSPVRGLGRVRSRQKRWAEAEGLYRRAIEMAPDHPTAYAELGAAVGEQGRAEEALKWIARSVQIEPAYWLGNRNMTVALQRLGRHDEAMTYLKRAVRVRPEDPTTVLLYGSALARRGELEHAEIALGEAARLDPALKGQAMLSMGAALLKAGRSAEAERVLRTGIDADPERAALRYNLGLVLSALGRDGEALASFEEAARLDPTSVDARMNEAELRLKAGDRAGAVESAKRALEAARQRGDAELEGKVEARLRAMVDHQPRP